METDKKIDAAMVAHIATLSRLALTEAEVTKFTSQLGAIIDYASHLPELTVTPETALSLRLDDDIARPSENPQELLQNAVALQDGYVKVPAILDRGETS